MPDFHVTFWDLLHAVNLLHGTDGFTSHPKEGVLRIFFALKSSTASVGFEPANLGTKGQHATSRPPKPTSNMLVFPVSKTRSELEFTGIGCRLCCCCCCVKCKVWCLMSWNTVFLRAVITQLMEIRLNLKVCFGMHKIPHLHPLLR